MNPFIHGFVERLIYISIHIRRNRRCILSPKIGPTDNNDIDLIPYGFTIKLEVLDHYLTLEVKDPLDIFRMERMGHDPFLGIADTLGMFNV